MSVMTLGDKVSLAGAPVLVVGAGIMGTGIAQVAAQSGHLVFLFDARDGAAEEAKTKLATQLEGLTAKGRLTAQAMQQTLTRIQPIGALPAASEAALVVEAVVEKLDVKRKLFRELEDIVAPTAILASNTSSISVTAMANGLRHPGRVVGLHFFNPVPLMRLVEVVHGLRTDAAVADAVFDLSLAWGKTPVHARSTPGFIVNRIARPFYAETLALLQEQAAAPEVLDACLRAAGFRMGPCELMDLIGHDTNFSVTQSVYEANFCDKRYVPSLLQRELVDGGLLGRKSGRGFYPYPEGTPALPVADWPVPKIARKVTVHGTGPMAEAWVAALMGHQPVERRPDSDWMGVQINRSNSDDDARLVLTDGRPAHEVAAATGVVDVAVFDRPFALPWTTGTPLAYAMNGAARDEWSAQVPAWLNLLGFTPALLQDAPGLVVARTVAMLINEAADAVQQGVCTREGADAAMKLGVNYPAGPFEWLQAWSVPGVVGVLDALDAAYRGERYRVSPWLRRHVTA